MEDDNIVVPVIPGPSNFLDLLLYDLSKYLLTLCLFILGGVLTLTETAESPLPPIPIVVIIGSLAVSGLLSISCIGAIINARHAGRRARFAQPMNSIATAFLGAGVGAFLVVWIKQLF